MATSGKKTPGKLGALLAKVRAFFRKKPVRVVTRVISSIFKCFMTVLLIGVITFTIVASVMTVYVVRNFDGNEGLPDLDDLSVNETSIIYTQAAEGQWQEYQRLEGTDSIWVDLDDIPLNLQHAVVAIEDKRFYDHYGVDWMRTVMACANLVLHFRSTEFGGSTITQQLIKVTTGDNDTTIERKITEIMRAITLERNLGDTAKDEIMQAYLNVLPLSGNIVGVGAAANAYFGKNVSDLSLAQCAAIAGITQNPSKFNPYTHPENLRARQRTVLAAMLDQGWITQDEYVQAVNEELIIKSSVERVSVQDYYVDLLIEDVANDLMKEYGYPYSQAISKIYRGGLRIYSYENPTLQAKAEEVYANEKNFPASIETDDSDPQGAIFVMDYEGHTVATVGGRGQKTQNRVKNRSTDSLRQCGSTIKPLTSYGPAVSMNLVHFSSIVRDAPITLPNGSQWPPNYGQSVGDRGDVLLCVALQKSLNTVAAQLMSRVTVDESYKFLTGRLQFSTLTADDKNYAPLTLGGFTNGVTCREMAQGFQIFGSGGYFQKAVTYSRVEHDGEIILQTNNAPIRVMDEDSAYVMNRMLQRVVRYGTATRISGSWGGGWEVFAKTGTSGASSRSSNYDAYFCGGTPQYVAASWFGYDYNKGLNTTQKNYASLLWNQVMVALRDDSLSQKAFTKKGTTVEATFCTETGLLCGDGNTCPDTMVGVYKADNIPGYCTAHGTASGGVMTTTEGDGSGTTVETTAPVTIDLNEIYRNTTAPSAASTTAPTSSRPSTSNTTRTTEPADEPAA